MKLKFLFPLFLCLGACTHSVHLVNFSDFRPYAQAKEGQVVKAEAEQFTIMGFVFDNMYVDQAYDKLQAQCPHGAISGISTEYYSDHGFFSWTNHIVMQGLCVSKS